RLGSGQGQHCSEAIAHQEQRLLDNEAAEEAGDLDQLLDPLIVSQELAVLSLAKSNQIRGSRIYSTHLQPAAEGLEPAAVCPQPMDQQGGGATIRCCAPGSAGDAPIGRTDFKKGGSRGQVDLGWHDAGYYNSIATTQAPYDVPSCHQTRFQVLEVGRRFPRRL